jgi:putative ABC transport system permease protein
MAFEHVRAGFGRMALSVVAIALGVALVVAIRLMNAAVLASFLDTVDGVAGRAALTVSAGEGLTFPEDAVETVAAVPGVRLAVPLVRAVAFPDDGTGELLTVHGVDLANEPAVRVYHDADDPNEVIDDLLVFLSQPDSMVLGREFAARRGLAVGSVLPLVTPTGVRPFTVRGLLDPQGLAKTLGGRLVVMDLYAAEKAFTAPGQVNQIDVLLAEGATVEGVKAAIAGVLPPGLKVQEPAVRRDMIRKTVGGFQAMLTAFSLLAVVAGFVICYSRLGAIFEARTWEVGVLRAVGLRRAVVFGELLKESLLLGGVGTLLGILLGTVIGQFGLPVVARTTALNFRLPVAVSDPRLALGPVFLGAAVGLCAAVLAAAVPALRLARKEPIAALTLRGRGSGPASRVSAWLALGSIALVGALIALQQLFDFTELGIGTTAFMVMAACACAGPLVRLTARALLSLSRHSIGPSVEFAADHLSEHSRRVSLTVATLGAGLAAVLMFGMLGWSFERTLIAQLASRMRADMVVTSSFASDGYRPSPLSEAVRDKLRSIPGVLVVAGEQERDIEYGAGSTLLDAYDVTCFTDSRACAWILSSGSLPNGLEHVARGEAVLVSSSFAHQHKVGAGAIVRVPSPSGGASFTIAGVTTGQPVSAIIMTRESYRQLFKDPMVTWMHVSLAPAVSYEEVERTVMRAVGREFRVQVRSSRTLIEYFADQARRAFGFTYMMEAITFILVSIAIGDALASSVIERTRQFGMMRAVGLRGTDLSKIVIVEGAVIGVLGLALAAAAGLALGTFWVGVQFPAILGWKLDLHFPTSFTLLAAVLTLSLCLIGSILPALRAAHLTIPRALRDE